MIFSVGRHYIGNIKEHILSQEILRKKIKYERFWNLLSSQVVGSCLGISSQLHRHHRTPCGEQLLRNPFRRRFLFKKNVYLTQDLTWCGGRGYISLCFAVPCKNELYFGIQLMVLVCRLWIKQPAGKYQL